MKARFRCSQCEFAFEGENKWFVAWKASVHVKGEHGDEKWRQIFEKLEEHLKTEG